MEAKDVFTNKLGSLSQFICEENAEMINGEVKMFNKEKTDILLPGLVC